MKQRRRAARPRWACAACEELGGHALTGQHLHKGKQAIKNNHHEFIEGDVECGLDFDAAFTAKHPSNHRFDYLLVLRSDCSLVAVEVHPASSTRNVDELIQKKRETQHLLKLEGFKVSVTKWHWVATTQGRTVFHALDKYGLKLAAGGIEQPRRKVRLDE